MLFTRRTVFHLLAGASVIGALAFSGCGKRADDNQNAAIAPTPMSTPDNKLKLGFIVSEPNDLWHQWQWKSADEAAQKHGFELLKIGAPDAKQALSAINLLAANGAKGFVISTPDSTIGEELRRKAKSKNLKVIAVDEALLGEDGKPLTDVPYLGTSPQAIGTEVGKRLYVEMQKRQWPLAETAVLAITAGGRKAKSRTEAAVDALQKAGFPTNRIFQTSDAKNVIAQHSSIKRWLVCGADDNAVIAAVRSLEDRGFKADRVIAIGIGGTQAREEFQEPTPSGLWGSMLVSPKEHGFRATEILYQWIAEGKEPPQNTVTAGILITRDNYKNILQEQGIPE